MPPYCPFSFRKRFVLSKLFKSQFIKSPFSLYSCQSLVLFTSDHQTFAVNSESDMSRESLILRYNRPLLRATYEVILLHPLCPCYSCLIVDNITFLQIYAFTNLVFDTDTYRQWTIVKLKSCV